MKTGEDGLVDLDGSPAGQLHPAVYENFHQTDHAGVLDFDAGKLGRAHLKGQGQALKEREVHMDVGPLRLVCGETIGDAQEPVADRAQVLESLFEPEVPEVVGAEFISEEGGELLVLAEEGVLEIDAEHVMAMLDLFECRV